MGRELLVLAAEISNPWGEASLEKIDGPSAPAVAAVLRGNHVSFLALERKHGPRILASPLAGHVQAERKQFLSLRAEYERIRRDLEESGTRCMLFKSTGLFPAFPHLSSNLDVLVEPGFGDLARRRLHALGYAELLNIEEPGKFLFRRFAQEGSFTFHLHEVVGWGVPFLDTEDVWAGATRSTEDAAVWIPGPREALLVTTAHWFYENKTLSLQNLYLTADALGRLSGSLGDAARSAARRGWEGGFMAALAIFDEAWGRLFGEGRLDPVASSGVAARLAELRFASRLLRHVSYGERCPAEVPFLRNKAVYYRKVLADGRRPFTLRVVDVAKTILWAIRWKLHVRSQKPLLVTVSGCDGSGKTLQVERLRDAFETCDVRVTTVWARGASSPLMGFLIRTARGVTGRRGPEGRRGSPGGEAARTAERRRVLASRGRRMLFAWAYALDLAVVYALKVRWFLLTGHVVVCDRYVDDAQVDFAVMSGASLDELPFPLRALRAASPRPQAAFLLDVDAEEALRRKPEEGGVEHIEAARRMFASLLAGRAVAVPASATAGGAAELIAREGLSRFYRRYGTLLNGLLASNPGQLNPRRWRA